MLRQNLLLMQCKWELAQVSLRDPKKKVKGFKEKFKLVLIGVKMKDGKIAS